MERRRFLIGTAAVGSALVAGCSSSDGSTPRETTDGSGDTGTTPPDDETTTDPGTGTPEPDPPSVSTEVQNGSFEDDLSGWTVGRDLPDQPGGDQPVDSDIGSTTAQAADGEQGLEISIDGSADDGTVWVQQTVDPADVSTLRVDGYSDMESFNTVLKLATYVGPEPEDGLSEADFDTTKKLADHEGWKTYEYDIDAEDGPVVVAVGLTIVWETGATGILDDVRLA